MKDPFYIEPPKEPVVGMSFFTGGNPSEPFAWLQSLKVHGEYNAYVTGYKQAIHALVREARRSPRDNVYLDHVVLPLLFLIRHYVEVQLKTILWMNGLIERIYWPAEENHTLEKLWQNCREIFRNRSDFSCDYLDLVEKPILELHQYDPSSQVFRYAYSKRKSGYKKHLEPLPDHINYEHVMDVFERLDCAFGGMLGDLTAEYETRQEARDEEPDFSE